MIVLAGERAVGVGECEIGRSALLQRLRDSGCGPVPLPLDHDSLLHWVTGSADVHMSDALAFKSVPGAATLPVPLWVPPSRARSLFA